MNTHQTHPSAQIPLIPYRAAPKRNPNGVMTASQYTPHVHSTSHAGFTPFTLKLTPNPQTEPQPINVNVHGTLISVSEKVVLQSAFDVGADCTIAGDADARLEVAGRLTTQGGARAITNNLKSEAADSLLISGIMCINDTPPLRKTITLGGPGGTTVTGLIKNNLGSGSLTCAGRVTLSGTENTYTGVTTVVLGSMLTIGSLTDGGIPCSIGAASTVPSNLIISGEFIYKGDKTAETNRLFTVNSTVGTVISNESESAEATLVFHNTDELGLGSSNMPRQLGLSGSHPGDNRLNPALIDNGYGPSSLAKKGPGRWIVAGNNRHTGGTIIYEGELSARHSGALGKGSVMVCDNGTLELGGDKCDTVHAGPGLLVVNGTLKLASAKSSLVLTGEAPYIFNGRLDLNGVFNRMPPGEYPVVTGGPGRGRYVDNMREITGYRRNGHRAEFRQGVVIISKVD